MTDKSDTTAPANALATTTALNHEEADSRHAHIRQMAKDQYETEGEIEIDNNAVVSEGDDNGAYVQAWVWVNLDGTEFDKHPQNSPKSISSPGLQN